MVRIGIVGIGGMGRVHATYLAAGEVPGATLAAVADVSPDALAWAERTLGDGVKLFETSDAMLESGEIDAVMIAAPHYFHPPVAMAAFSRGIHVLSEKPAGVYVKAVRAMNAAAEKSGVVFAIMFNQRTRPVHQRARQLVASGELGEIRRTRYVITNWFRSQSYYDSGGWRATWAGEGGGVLVNQCPHNLDLWQWICGMPTRVRAFCRFGQFHNIEVEDDVTAYVEYANGGSGTFITTTGEAPGSCYLEISGDRGKLLVEGNKLTFWRTTESVEGFLKSSPTSFDQPDTWRCEIPVPNGDPNEHRTVTRNWVNAILNGTPLLARGDEGIHGVQLANAMLLSTWTDDWASVPTDEELYWKLLQEKIATSTYQKSPVGKALDFTGSF